MKGCTEQLPTNIVLSKQVTSCSEKFTVKFTWSLSQTFGLHWSMMSWRQSSITERLVSHSCKRLLVTYPTLRKHGMYYLKYNVLWHSFLQIVESLLCHASRSSRMPPINLLLLFLLCYLTISMLIWRIGHTPHENLDNKSSSRHLAS